MNKLFGVVLWTSETRKVGKFEFFLMFPHQYLFLYVIILLVDQQFNAGIVVRSGNFEISDRTELLFCPNYSFLFLLSQQLLNFQTFFFSFSKAYCQVLLASFSNYHLRKHPLHHDWGLAVVSFLKCTVHHRNISNMSSLTFQRVKFIMA